MADTISVDYRELLDETEEGADESGPYARKTYLVDWGDRFQFARDMAGTSSQPSIGGVWIRSPAFPYPDAAAGSNMYAKKLQIKPEGWLYDYTTPVSWSHARIVVTFGTLTWDANPTDDPNGLASLSQDPAEMAKLAYCTQEIDYGAQWHEIPNSSLKWQSDSAPVNSPVARKMNLQRLVLTWHKVPLIPMGKVGTYAESINDKSFLGCAKGTVKFEGCRTVREATVDGTVVQMVQMNFSFRSVDWNKQLRPDGLSYDFVVDNSGNMNYAYKNYADLLLG